MTVTLRAAIEGTYGGRIAAEPLHHFDEAGRVRLYPDLVGRLAARQPA